MTALIGDALRERCTELLDEILGSGCTDDAVDAIVAVITQAQAARLTPEDRRGLAAVYGYELGVDEGSLEVTNIRRLLERHGVRECDRHGEVRSTIAMVEDVVVSGRRPRSGIVVNIDPVDRR